MSRWISRMMFSCIRRLIQRLSDATEQTVLYQAAKFRALFADDTEDLMFKEKIHIGGILHIRGNSDMFHLLTV